MTPISHDLSPEQARGIDLSQSIGMIAGAGSGKTRVLTARFLEILDNFSRKRGASAGAALRSIVAITYTRKASAEMRERIAERCIELAESAEETEFWSETALKMAEARISTIHQFCAALLFDYPIEAGIDQSNLEGANAQDTVTVAVNRFRRAVSKENHPLNPLLREFLDLTYWDFLQKMLVKAFNLRSLLEPFFATLPETPQELVRKWHSRAESLYERIDKNALTEIESAYNGVCENDGKGSIGDQLADTISIIAKTPCDITSPESIIEIRNTLVDESDNFIAFGNKGSAKNWPTATIKKAQSAVKRLREAVEKISPYLPFKPQEGDIDSASALILFAKIFAGFIESEGENLPPKAETTYDDLIIASNKIVQDDKIAKSITKGLSGLLVDEFQDTDQLQWNTISILSDFLEGKLFWVGDPKQSIYKFRGADVSNVRKAMDWTSDGRGEIFTLDDNYRTAPAVLTFVNHISEGYLSEPPLVDLSFHAIPQKLECKRRIAEGHRGSVEFLISGEKPFNAEAELIARRIYSAVLGDKNGDGILEVDDDEGGLRRAKWGDIAVLYPSRGQLELLLQEALLARDIPHFVVGGQGFFASTEISTLLDLIIYLDDTRDDLALLSILRGPLFSMPDSAIYAAKLAGEGDIRAGIAIIASSEEECPARSLLSEEEIRVLEDCNRVLEAFRRQILKMRPSELISHIVTERGMWAYFRAQQNGAQRIANIEKFLRMLSEFDEKGIEYAAKFCYGKKSTQETEREESVITEGRDAVRLMTVHQSKGLEFPIVIAAHLAVKNRGYKEEDSLILYDDFMGCVAKASAKRDEKSHYYQLFKALDKEREYAETKRVFYVATSRARDHLILSGQKPKGRYFDLIPQNIMPEKDALSGRSTMNIDTSDGTVEIKLSIGLESWEIEPQEQKPGMPLYYALATGEHHLQGIPLEPQELEMDGEYYLAATDLPQLLGSPKEMFAKRISGAFEGGGFGTEWGSAVHRFFDLLPSPLPNENEIRKIAENALKIHKISPKRIDYLIALAQNNIIKNIYSEKAENVRTEERIVLVEKGFMISGIIDRLWKDSKGWHIADFKTDAVEGEARITKANFYAPQIEVYRRALSKALGIAVSEITASIIFTHNAVERVFIQPLDFDEILQKVRAALVE
jgi:ATP-dependent helicase/nuclease subunit A